MGRDAVPDLTHRWEPIPGTEAIHAEGGPFEPLSTAVRFPYDIEVDDAHVYWADAIDYAAHIFRVPKTGGATETIYEGMVTPMHLALDATHVYMSDQHGGRVVRIHKQSLAEFVIAGDVPIAEDVAVDDEAIYFHGFEDNELRRVLK